MPKINHNNEGSAFNQETDPEPMTGLSGAGKRDIVLIRVPPRPVACDDRRSK